MNENQHIVYIVDDDQAVCDSLKWLMESIGLAVKIYTDGQVFVADDLPYIPSCAVLDVRMPSISGLEVLEQLGKKHSHMSVIMVTGHADVAMATRAMKLGAFDFIEKPYNDQQLLDAVQNALRDADTAHQKEHWQVEVDRRMNTLTPREKDVLELVVDGQPNKLIADKLSLSIKTIEVHRANLMQKMQAGSLASLLRMIFQGKP